MKAAAKRKAGAGANNCGARCSMSSGLENEQRRVGHDHTKATSNVSIAREMMSRQQLMVVERGSKKAGSSYLQRVQDNVGRSWKACCRGHACGVNGRRVREHSSTGSDTDGMARRVGARRGKGGGHRFACSVCRAVAKASVLGVGSLLLPVGSQVGSLPRPFLVTTTPFFSELRPKTPHIRGWLVAHSGHVYT